MTTINPNDKSTNSYGLDEAIQQNPSLSETTELENNFISLMVAQIKNQDPTEPVDSTQFLNQFSAMSQVKSMENMSKLSEHNLVLMDNLQTLTAAGLVGQEVEVAVDSLRFADEPVHGQIHLEHAATKTSITLTDSNGVKKEVQLGAQAPGPVNFTLNPAELSLAPGQYKIEVRTDSGEQPAVGVAGLVTRVQTSNEGPVLEVAGAGSVPFYNITGFRQAQLDVL